jgi:hypothetical protein
MFKKRDYKLCSRGYIDLATAVVRQWRDDGRPMGDAEGAKMWAQLLDAHKKQMHSAIRAGELKL